MGLAGQRLPQQRPCPQGCEVNACSATALSRPITTTHGDSVSDLASSCSTDACSWLLQVAQASHRCPAHSFRNWPKGGGATRRTGRPAGLMTSQVPEDCTAAQVPRGAPACWRSPAAAS